MENSSVNPQSRANVQPEVSNINYSPLPPQAAPPPQPKKGMGKSIMVVLFVFLIILSIIGISFYYFSKTPNTYNAKVYTPPNTAKIVPSPTPTQAVINKNDNSNNALDSDSKIIDKDIQSANSDLDGVNQSFSDEQTNLQ